MTNKVDMCYDRLIADDDDDNDDDDNNVDDGDDGYNHPYLFLTHIWKIILPVLFVEDWTLTFMDSSLCWAWL